LCHILANYIGPNTWELFFTDLHRADCSKRIGRRWMIKDLAALNYSSPENIITRADRIRFLKSYLRAERISDGQKSFAQQVLKKSEKMRMHTAKSIKSEIIP
jgi:hypothetical protein